MGPQGPAGGGLCVSLPGLISKSRIMTNLTEEKKTKIAEEERYQAEQRGKAEKKKTNLVTWVVLTLILVPIVLIFLGADGDNDASSLSSPTTTAACEEISKALIAKIESGINAYGEISLTNAKAVRFDDKTDVWYVAGRIIAPGLEDGKTIATWSVDRLDGEAAIYAVDTTAREFSDFNGAGNRVSGNKEAQKAADHCVIG